MTEDRLYAQTRARIDAFRFDAHVAQVFADMIARSVPGYGLLLDMISVITREYAKPDTNLYDLGCSLGASTLAMRHAAPDGSRIIAIDNAPAMIERAQTNIAMDTSTTPVSLLCDDIRQVVFESPASLMTFNLTLQFIPPTDRLPLLTRMAEALLPGGALILSEKIQLPDAGDNQTLIDLHHGFKRAQGYSELEIAQKRSALDNVLVPDTLDTHIARLQQAGFSHVVPWFQCFNFISLLAVR
ncbi:MAG: carboxy-S-adenosyl-L-methionine synthase CmoA [Gammaproteobacteria bacterium]|nr:MAG: carboxy-S-adenosyl-L-methionine synthase CmoA [Gammaproteobacteria bacterium]